MKRKHSVLCQVACAASALLFLCGCAQTSSDTAPSLIQLDTAQMVETAASEAPQERTSTLRKRLDAPETYRYEEKNGIVALTIHAPVSIPEVSVVPVVRTRGVDFSQEQVDTILALLWRNDSMWDNNPPLTKAQVEEQIASIEYNLEHLPDYQDEREYFETIRLPELREMLNTVPESADPVQSDGQLLLEQILDGRTDKVVANATQLSIHGGTGQYLSVRNNNDNTAVIENTREGRLWVSKWARLLYQSSTEGVSYDQVMTTCAGTEVAPVDQTIPAAKYANVVQSPAQAATIVKDFFLSLGEDISIYDMFLLDDEGQGAYLIRCVRNVQSIPCIPTSGESMILDAESENEELPGAVWANETIAMVVSETGVLQFNWESPHQLGETLVKDCALLSFSEIMEVCANMLPLLFDEQWGHIEDMTSASIHIDKIEFGMLRIIKNQSIDEGLMIPVWAFYGAEPFESASLGSQNPPAKQSRRLLVINAIDGTVVVPS